MKTRVYDVIIIGAGAAGLTAGIYCGRSGLDTLIIEEDSIGGLANKSYHIGNYPGFPNGIKGLDLMDAFYEQALAAGVQFRFESVQSLQIDKIKKSIETNNCRYESYAVIIATGGQPKKIGAIGEEKFMGKGISFCTVCDGAETKGKIVMVIGTGDTAIDQSIYLTQFADFVFISSNNPIGQLDCTDKEKLKWLPQEKIKVLWNTKIHEFCGTDHLSKVVLEDMDSKERFQVTCDYCFEFIGFTPNSVLVEGRIELDKDSGIVTNAKMETSNPGVYAIGDVRKKVLKQLATATADGAIAASEVKKYIDHLIK